VGDRPQQFDEVFRRAATIGEHLSVSLMASLLDQRGTPEATLGTLDLVTALVDRMSDTTLSQFLVKALGSDGATSPRFSEVMTTLLPESGRRRRVVVAAQGVAFEAGGVLEKWDELEQNLDDYLDSRFVPEQYARELHSAKSRAAGGPLHTPDPPERVAGWLRSIDGDAVEALDVQMLLDLAIVETEPSRALAVVELLRGHVTEAAGAANWPVAARLAEAIRLVARTRPTRPAGRWRPTRSCGSRRPRSSTTRWRTSPAPPRGTPRPPGGCW